METFLAIYLVVTGGAIVGGNVVGSETYQQNQREDMIESYCERNGYEDSVAHFYKNNSTYYQCKLPGGDWVRVNPYSDA